MYVNKATMIETLSDRLGGKRTATDAVDAVIDTITRAVARGERVAITGFGVFERVARPARTGRNPRTGASVKIKKTTVPKFKAGQHFKDVVSGAKKVAPSAGAAKSTASKSTATKTSAAKSTAKKAPAKSASKSTAKAPARSAAKKAPARSAAKKAPAKKSTTKAASPRKASTVVAKKSATKRTAKR